MTHAQTQFAADGGAEGRAPAESSIAQMVQAQLARRTTAWSLGVPGAIAELHRTPGDEALTADPLCIVAREGALRLRLRDDARAHAYEVLSARPAAWHHGVVLSLPEAAARMKVRRVVTELGPDHDAVRPEDKNAMLFDLGLGSPYVDFCVRTADPGQIALLRAAAGTSLLNECCDLYDAIVRASPHRVFCSALGRIEIYQPIGRPGGDTPHGPHTHLLPRLFRPERAQLPHVTVPPGRAPCVTIYPENPIFDGLGVRKPFDRLAHESFQTILAVHGDPKYVSAKGRVVDAVLAGMRPDALALPSRKYARIACRIALRQLYHAHEPGHVERWLHAFDRPARLRPEAALSIQVEDASIATAAHRAH